MKEYGNPVKGMNKDLHQLNTGEDTYVYALNAMMENDTGGGFLLQNDFSNILGTSFLPNENVIARKYLSELDTIVMFTTANRILAITSKLYSDANMNAYNYETGSIPLSPDNQTPTLNVRVLAESECFNWNIHHKVDLVHKITDSTLNLYFVDGGYNEDRYIYFDLPTLTVNESFLTIIGYDEYERPVRNENIDCNKLKWYPEISYPQLTLDDTEGGNLLAGVYQFSVSYATSKGISLTNYKGMVNPFPIFTKELTDVTNYNSGKAIEITIDNLDVYGRYEYVNLVVTKTIDGVTTHDKIATLPIAPKIKYTYTGDDKAIPVDEIELYQIYPFYRASNGVTKANNKLFKYGIRDFDKYNLQPVFNQIKLKWFTVTAEEGDYKKPQFAQNYRSYVRDEVYMFGIKLILDNGEESQVYPLLGRKAEPFDLEDVTNKDAVVIPDDCSPTGPKKRWQVYNTAKVTKSPVGTLNKCDYKIHSEGDFAYWQSTEKYPNDPDVWGENAGLEIRGFKMPDCLVAPIQNGTVNAPITYDQKNFIYPLGVKLDDDTDIYALLQQAVNQGLITEAQKNRVRGYKIVRGNRVGRESIIAKGWLGSVWAYVDKDQLIYYPNHGFDDLGIDPYLASRDLSTINDMSALQYRAEYFPVKRHTFNSPDTSFRQPNIGTILKIESSMYGEARGFFSQSRKHGEYVILGQLHYNFAIVIAWLMTHRLKLSEATADAAAAQGGGVGSAVGGVIGGVVGAFAGGIGAPLGAALGSGLGGVIGRIMGRSTSSDDYVEMYRITMWIQQTDSILELMQNTIPMQNYHWQHQAIGKYTNTTPVLNDGFKQRRITFSAYVDGTRQLLNGSSFNNYLRESTVYLELDDNLNKPQIIDDSKYTAQREDECLDEYQEVRSTVSSHYASIKREVVNQYGNIFSIEWIPVSGTVWNADEIAEEFGGDKYLTRFAYKRKHSFFRNTAFDLPSRQDIYYSDESNIAYPLYFFNTKYTELDNPAELDLNFLRDVKNSSAVLAAMNNIERPQAMTDNNLYDINKKTNPGIQNGIARIFRRTLLNPYVITRPGRYRLDCESDEFWRKEGDGTKDTDFVEVPNSEGWWNDIKPYSDTGVSKFVRNSLFKFTAIKGKIYTYNYAIPYFICESDVNVDFRHAPNAVEKDFYPHQTNLDYWLQQENVEIKIDNDYSYNRTYSKQNKEEVSNTTDINFFKNKNKTYYQNRVIYSQDGAEVENVDYKDNYLNFKPLDYFDFTFENGKLISVDSIESEQVLVRFENNTRIFNAFSTIQTDGASLAIGNGSLFGARPQEFSKTELGYIGSQHTDMLNTEFGHIIVDAKRGNVFNLASGGKGMDELTKDGMRNWMSENLPFRISSWFPEVNIDNNFAGIGLALSFDKRYKRFFITKLDYIPTVKGITFKDNEFYFNDSKISVRDPRYFCNASWTISYSFFTKSWTSFHSFKPNYYVDGINLFYTGLNGLSEGGSSLWVHNLTNKDFQTYYLRLHPFIIEAQSKPSISGKIISDVSFALDVKRTHNEYDTSSILDVAFNKAMVFNETQHSGVLELNVINPDNLRSIMQFPEKRSDHTRIAMKRNEYLFSFNQFADITFKNNLPRFINSCNNADNVVNLKAIDYLNNRIDNNYIRSDKSFVRLINDKHSKYKFIFKGLLSETTPSIR